MGGSGRRRRLLAGMLVAALCVGAAACGDDGGDDDAADAATTSSAPAGGEAASEDVEPATVRVQIASRDSFAYLDGWAAVALGLFEEHGIEVDMQEPTNNGAQAALQLGSGDADFALTPPASTVATIVAGRDARLIAAGATTPTAGLALSKEVADRIAAEQGVTPDSPVADRVKALEGLKINAATPGGPLERLLRTALAENGMDPESSVQLVLSSQSDAASVLAQLASGAIDGFVLSAPPVLQPVLTDQAVLWLSGPEGELGDPGNYVSWSASLDMIENHPDVVQRFVDALDDFGEIMRSDPDRVSEAVREQYSAYEDDIYAASFEFVTPSFTNGPGLTQDMIDKIVTLHNETAESQAEPGLEVADPRFME